MNIKEIAKIAGVSVATISRVLNHPEVVQPETRDHVLAVMEKYNYRPNWFARSLNLQRTNTLALITPSIEDDMYQKITAGIELVAHKKNYIIFLCNTHNELENELKYLDMIINRKVDGVIFTSSTLSKENLEELNKVNIPFVFTGINEIFENENICYINFEDSAFKMTTHLLELGHHNIDLVVDKSASSKPKSMVKGYTDGIESLNGQMGNIYYTQSGIEGGYLIAKKLIAQKKLPKAIFASDDEIAFGIMKAAWEENIQIPNNLAVAGFSNSPMASLIRPELTTVEQPSKRLGMVAARMLFDILEDEEYATETSQKIILQPTLKIRRSCGNEKYIYELFE